MSTFGPAYRRLRPLCGAYLYPSMRGWPQAGGGVSGLDALFPPSYSLVRKHEGYYLNDPKDLGGETYAGVARKIWPSWSGWAVVDAWKRKMGRSLNTNEALPAESGIEAHVERFYNDRWNASKAGLIDDQDVANIFFDFYILAAKAVATFQEVLRDLGQSVSVDNVPGSQTMAAANAVNPAALYQKYKEARIQYHHDRVNSGAVSASFLPGWIKRTMDFPDKAVPIAIGGVLVAGTVLFFLLHKPANTWIKQQFKKLVA